MTTAQVEWAITIAANGLDDLETQLPDLIAAIVRAGGWIMGSAISERGAVRIRFEFERQSSMEIYAALMAGGLELSSGSHLQLAQLCHCTKNCDYDSSGNRTAIPKLVSSIAGTAMVELNLLASQVDNFDQMPEPSLVIEAGTGTSSA